VPATDTTLVSADEQTYAFVGRGRNGHAAQLGIEPIFPHADERGAVGLLVARPGRVLIGADCPQTAEMLERLDIEVVPLP
jgi:hypothetical protein